MTALVLTVVGDDQAGLVDALSGVIVEHGGNWDTSEMARLGGKFAGIVLLTVPDANADALVEALAPIQARGLLDITVSRAASVPPTGRSRPLTMELVGQDHPGIVHDISHALASQDVSIRELHTETTSAPMAGGALFNATAVLDLPEDLPVAEVRRRLESLANELMVDIALEEGPADP